MSTCWTSLSTPIGELYIEADDVAVTHIWFEGENFVPPSERKRSNDVTNQAKAELAEYFAGTRMAFTFPIQAEGTEFQQAVWKELLKIKYGATSTYGQLAKAIHRPITAARGVGQACGHNPLPIVVPCHRVVGKTGSLTGFGGGTWRKDWLLRLEQGDLFGK